MNHMFATHPQNRSRIGSTSMLVIVVIVMLAFAIYAFSNQVELDYASLRTNIKASQLRQNAYSRLAWLEANLAQRQTTERIQWLHDTFDEKSSLDSPKDLQSVRLLPNWSPGFGERGLMPEASKLDLNSLDLSPAKAVESRSRLMALPRISAEMADAILDWLDPDDETRVFGAEAAWYRGQGRKTVPRNGPLSSIHELTYVRGFNEANLFGEDANHNGWLDWNENDGERAQPKDNADGILDVGFAKYFCVDSYESNLQWNGQPKIYINDNDLARLYSRLESQFGREAATFVVAYRLDGPYRERGIESQGALQQELSDTLEERIDAQMRSAPPPETSSMVNRTSNHPSGLDLRRLPRHRIQSLFDLLDANVVSMVGTAEQLLQSPWQTENGNTAWMMTRLTEVVTCDLGAQRRGGIDAGHASMEVLNTIPGMSTSTAHAIVKLRPTLKRSLPPEYFTTPIWLLKANLVSLEQLQMLAPHLAFQPANYTGYAVGQDPRAERALIVRFRLSCEGPSVRLQELRDIGYQRIQPAGS